MVAAPTWSVEAALETTPMKEEATDDRRRHQMNQHTSDPMLGKLIAERYIIETLIGQGGMGSIYRARHTKLNRHTANAHAPNCQRPIHWDRSTINMHRFIAA